MINSESQRSGLCYESNKMQESFESTRAVSETDPQRKQNLAIIIGTALICVVLIVCIVVGLTSTKIHDIGE